MYGRKGFISGVYIICVSGYPKMRYLFTNARDAEKAYREEFGLKYKHISWTRALY